MSVISLADTRNMLWFGFIIEKCLEIVDCDDVFFGGVAPLNSLVMLISSAKNGKIIFENVSSVFKLS